MQKLVKKTRHYQTMVPVEAYEGEEKKDWKDLWQDELDNFLLHASCGVAIYSTATGLTPVGVASMAICVAGAANTDTGHEVIAAGLEFAGEAMEAQNEQDLQRMRADADLAEDVFGTLRDGAVALYDGATAGATAIAGAIVDAVEATTLSNDGPPPR